MDMTGDAQATGITEAEAAERIASLLTPPGDSDGSETPKPPKAKAQAAEPDEDEDDAEEAEPETDEEESETEDEPDDEEAPQPKVFKVKVADEEVEVTEDELLRGYSRTQDYTRKTMELAEARKALEPERQALRQEREQYANLLPQLYANLQTQMQAPELEQLRHTDPGEWAARVREMEQQEAAIRAEHERVTRLNAQEAAKEQQEERTREAHALLAAVPEFKDAKAFQEVVGYALEIGFTPDDIQETVNHRAYVVLHKAMLYDRLKAKAPQTKAKVEAVKTAKPGSAANQPSKVTELTRAKQRLAKTGRVEDAQAAIERMLG